MHEAQMRHHRLTGRFGIPGKNGVQHRLVLLGQLRKDRRHLYEAIENGHRSDDGDYIPTDFADWREIPSEALEQAELRQALQKALQTLPEKYRTVLILRDVQQLSITETAQALGITEENVKTRTSRARLQMRDLLAPGWGGQWSKTASTRTAV